MDIQLDAEFFVQLGDFSEIGKLSKRQLTNLIENSEIDIKRAKRNRRLREETRERRISCAESIQKACTFELLKRIQGEENATTLKALLCALRKRIEANTVREVTWSLPL